MPIGSTRPFTTVCVVWHPASDEGKRIADALYNHYRRDLFENVAGGTGLSVMFRMQPLPGAPVPLSIPFDDAETTAVVVLLDEHLTADPDWLAYVEDHVRRAEEGGLRTRVFPVALSESAYKIGGSTQDLNYLPWVRWKAGSEAERLRILIMQLSEQFCRMLRIYLGHLEHPGAAEDELRAYLKRVQVFLSHSKHDAHGLAIADAIRQYISSDTGLDSFFDALHIPPGLPFADVLIHYVRVSAVVAIHTDSYSSREWCRREIIEAKRVHVPLVVANAIADAEERGFPYLGNVPVVRVEAGMTARIPLIIARLLDEVLKDLLWKCRVSALDEHERRKAVFLPRYPELISLVGIIDDGRGRDDLTIVYPDPPLSAEEIRLFDTLVPGVRLHSMTRWLAAAAA